MNLSMAIEAYLQDRKAKRYAAGTIRNHQYTLENMLRVVGDLQTKSLTVHHIDAFIRANPQWGDGTLNRVISTLSAFFKWLQSRGYMSKQVNLLDGLRYTDVNQRNRIIIPQSQFSTYLSGLEPRARVVAAIGLYLFTRISETVDLRFQDFHAAEVEVYRSKTKKVDQLPVCEELAEELDRWKFHLAASVGEAVQPAWYVVPGMQPSRFGVGGVRQTGVYLPTKGTSAKSMGLTVVKNLKDAGYWQPHEGTHTYRRSGAVALYNQLSSIGHDRSIRIVQAMLGHKNITMTERYLQLDLDRRVRNDVLSGKRMFPPRDEAQVVYLHGQENVGGHGV